MSVLVAVHTGPTSYALGADEQWTCPSGTYTTGTWPKAHRMPDFWLLGLAGNLGLCQELWEALNATTLGEHPDDLRRTLRSAWRSVLDQHTPPSDAGGHWLRLQALLVGPPGIVSMDGSGAVECHKWRHAVGTGDEVALGALTGALSVLNREDARRHDPAWLCALAVEAAAQVRNDCRGDQVLYAEPA